MHPIAASWWSRIRLALVGAVWLTVVIAGFGILLHYQWRPGALAGAPSRWPENVAGTLDPTRPTLLLFAHPRCPCTRATIEELDRIAARCRDRLRIVVFFLDRAELGERDERGDLWDRVAAIPGVDVRADADGAIAQRFGAETSGQTLLYSGEGRLLFRGGITGSRGHAGDNSGASAVVSWVGSGASPCTSTPVYGCQLFSPDPDVDGGIRP